MIVDPEQWGQGPRGTRHLFDSWCAAEAIEECPSSGNLNLRKAAFKIFESANGIKDEWGALVEWNDSSKRTHAEVLEAFDRAIAKAEGQP